MEPVKWLISRAGESKETAIPPIAQRALKQAHPDYPAPAIMHQADGEALLRKLCP